MPAPESHFTNVTIAYRSSDYRGRLAENEEHAVFRFFVPDQLPAEITLPIRPILQDWLAKAC